MKKKIVNLKVKPATNKNKSGPIKIKKINFKKKSNDYKVDNNPTTMFDLKASERTSQQISRDIKIVGDLKDKEMTSSSGA